MVVRLERRVCFLLAERARLPLPFDLPLPFGLRRANLRHLTFCGSIHTLRDATLIYDSQELVSTCNSSQKILTICG